MINITEKSNCCGCSACVQRCPKQCITLKEDEEGFLYPQIDKNECIECNLCEKVCPLINSFEKIPPIKVLAVKNRNEEERLASSSGGVFIALAKYVISHGGVVFGAVFDEKWEVKHTYTETIEGIRPMMESKYLQSRIENTFSEAEQFLKQGRKVMFTGTPCQITGLKKYLRKEYSNLLAVDFLCHGVPSPGVWRRYLWETFPIATAIGKNTVLSLSLKNVLAIAGISFRDKTLRGWKKFSFVIWGKSASKADKNSILLSAIHYDNPYMRGFLSDLYLRPSCYQCKCKNGTSHSDLTIADYWGINKLMPEFDDDKGVGLVLLNTKQGEDIFSKLDMDIRLSSLEDAKHFNRGFKEHITQHPKRIFFFKELKKGKTIESSINKALQISLFVKMKRKAKPIIKSLIRY